MTDSKSRTIGVLEAPHMMALLLYLAENEGCRKIDVYRDVSHNSTMSKRIIALEVAGLITLEQQGRGHLISLTTGGRSIASHIAKIRDELEETNCERSQEVVI